MLIDLLNLSSISQESALRLLSWQLNVLGAYFEMAIALSIFKLSQLCDFDLSVLFDYSYEKKNIITQI